MNLVGTHIGSYIVDKELGAGGTGTVYLCHHTLIERNVAVKVLHDDQAMDPDVIARFFQEAKAAAEIGHPNIIVIIDFGKLPEEHGGRPYLMMEALEGQSLDKRLRQGGLSLADITHILEQICSALIASHGKGIVHRDLKPSNVFLCDRIFDPLFVKLLDFGTAKLTAPAPGARRTQYGMVLGTPAYMSPEQCDGRGAIDHRSDIYSLGVMLYEMLTGTLPFQGEIREILIAHISHVPAPPRARNPAVPPEWEALCMRMMEKHKEARFQSITEVVQALGDLAAHASAYETFVAERATSGHSGSTQILTSETAGSGPTSDGRPAGDPDAGSRQTIVSTSYMTPRASTAVPEPSGRYVPEPSGRYVPEPSVPFSGIPAAVASGAHTVPVNGPTYPDHSIPYSASPSLIAACTDLCIEPHHAGFVATLLTRPEGHWWEIPELCQTSGTVMPRDLPHPMYVAWVEHPYRDPSLAAVVFLSLRTGWSTVVLIARRRW